MNINTFKIALAVAFIFVFSGCSKNNPNNVIPNAYVDVTLNIYEPSSFELEPIGGWIYHPGGSNGLIIYHANVDDYICYDRHSTYNVSEWCQVEVDSSNFKLIDPCSLSEFSIFDGSVIKAPASIPLKRYPVVFDGTYIVIRN